MATWRWSLVVVVFDYLVAAEEPEERNFRCCAIESANEKEKKEIMEKMGKKEERLNELRQGPRRQAKCS